MDGPHDEPLDRSQDHIYRRQGQASAGIYLRSEILEEDHVSMLEAILGEPLVVLEHLTPRLPWLALQGDPLTLDRKTLLYAMQLLFQVNHSVLRDGIMTRSVVGDDSRPLLSSMP